MGISRLVYGRSAMQGLYLNPDAWYDERGITTWLNTRRRGSTAPTGEVALGTGEKLPYDRLILADGLAAALVPPIDGLRRSRAPASCAAPPTRWRCAPTPSASAAAAA